MMLLQSKNGSLSEDPGLTTYFFPGRDGVGGWGYPGVSSSSTHPFDYTGIL